MPLRKVSTHINLLVPFRHERERERERETERDRERETEIVCIYSVFSISLF